MLLTTFSHFSAPSFGYLAVVPFTAQPRSKHGPLDVVRVRCSRYISSRGHDPGVDVTVLGRGRGEDAFAGLLGTPCPLGPFTFSSSSVGAISRVLHLCLTFKNLSVELPFCIFYFLLLVNAVIVAHKNTYSHTVI